MELCASAFAMLVHEKDNDWRGSVLECGARERRFERVRRFIEADPTAGS